MQRDHERKLEQLREDHRREMNTIREKYLDEVRQRLRQWKQDDTVQTVLLRLCFQSANMGPRLCVSGDRSEGALVVYSAGGQRVSPGLARCPTGETPLAA